MSTRDDGVDDGVVAVAPPSSDHRRTQVPAANFKRANNETVAGRCARACVQAQEGVGWGGVGNLSGVASLVDQREIIRPSLVWEKPRFQSSLEGRGEEQGILQGVISIA